MCTVAHYSEVIGMFGYKMDQLSSVPCILLTEKDASNELLWVWSYPAIIPGLRDLIKSKCTLGSDKEGEGEGLDFSFGHTVQVWYYLANFTVGSANTLPKVGYMMYSVQNVQQGTYSSCLFHRSLLSVLSFWLRQGSHSTEYIITCIPLLNFMYQYCCVYIYHQSQQLLLSVSKTMSLVMTSHAMSWSFLLGL